MVYRERPASSSGCTCLGSTPRIWAGLEIERASAAQSCIAICSENCDRMAKAYGLSFRNHIDNAV